MWLGSVSSVPSEVDTPVTSLFLEVAPPASSVASEVAPPSLMSRASVFGSVSSGISPRAYFKNSIFALRASRLSKAK